MSKFYDDDYIENILAHALKDPEVRGVLDNFMNIYHDSRILLDKNAVCELMCMHNRKYFKCVNSNLINYIRDSHTNFFSSDYNDQSYTFNMLSNYINYDRYKNLIYYNMHGFIRYVHLIKTIPSSDDVLNRLVEDYFYESSKMRNDDDSEYTSEEIHNLDGLAVYLLTYLYMNREYVEANNYIFQDALHTLMEPSSYDEMSMNGVFKFDEEYGTSINATIYYIEKAIAANKDKIHASRPM